MLYFCYFLECSNSTKKRENAVHVLLKIFILKQHTFARRVMTLNHYVKIAQNSISDRRYAEITRSVKTYEPFQNVDQIMGR